MFLIAAIMGLVSYMPAKATVVLSVPRQDEQKPHRARARVSIAVNAGSPFCVDFGMKVS